MVYDNDTLNILHKLTANGQIEYDKLLEEKGNEILFKHEHPFKYLIQKAKEMF